MQTSKFHDISLRFSLPEYVKTAAGLPSAGLSTLPDSAFADPVSRRYPIHTKSAAWLSSVDFADAVSVGAAGYSDADARGVVGRLSASAVAWDITSDLVETMSKLASEPETESKFALNTESGGSYFPVSSPELVKLSVDSFLSQRGKLTFGDRRAAALALLSGILEYDVDIAEEKTATLRTSTLDGGVPQIAFSSAFDTRASRLVKLDSELAAVMQKAASGIHSDPNGIVDAGTVLIFLDGIDQKSGLYKSYNWNLDLPEDGITTVKTAADTVKLANGAELGTDELSRFGVLALGGLSGDYFDSMTTRSRFDVEKAAEVLPTMPRDDAELFYASIRYHADKRI